MKKKAQALMLAPAGETKLKKEILFAMCIILLACNQKDKKKVNHFQTNNNSDKIEDNSIKQIQNEMPINDSANNLYIVYNTVDTIEHNGLSLTQTKIPINNFKGIAITKNRFDDYFALKLIKKGYSIFFLVIQNYFVLINLSKFSNVDLKS